MEDTFVMIKPDGTARGLIAEIIGRFERKGLKISAMKMMMVGEELAGRHYEMHVGKPFYEPLMEYITSGPVVPMVVTGDEAISVVRTVVGATDPKKADPGTIRGDYSNFIGRNLIHASDSPESAVREISLWFDEDEIVRYDRGDDPYLYE